MKAAWKIVVMTAAVSLVVAACVSPGERGKATRGTPEPPARDGAGRTYYVAPGGSDSNPGTRKEPWASPGYGSKQIAAGDTMVIRGGRYTLATFYDDAVTPPSGTESAPTVVKGEKGNRPVLAGRNDLFSAIDVSGKSHVRIENLEVTSDRGARFRVGVEAADGPVADLVLKDLYIHHIDEGAVNVADANGMLIDNCRMAYCGTGCIMGPAGRQGGVRDLVVRDCYLGYSGHYYRGGPGPGPYDRPDGYGIEASEGPVEIAHTVVEHNRGDGLDSKTANTYIHDCVVANNGCDGVKLWAHDGRIANTLIYGAGDGVGGGSPWAGIVISAATAGSDFEIVNVTLHDNPSRRAYPMYVGYNEKTPLNLLMRNTIVSNGHGEAYFGDNVRLTADHCLFYRPSGGTQVTAGGRSYGAKELEAGALGEGNRSGDPEFLKPAWGREGDFHLKKSSPAKDTGSTKGAPATDLDGNARPKGRACDMGCYQHESRSPKSTSKR